MIGPEDEQLHPFEPAQRHWQESYYFNWADPRHDLFGLTRIGFRYQQRRIDALVLVICAGRPAYIYPGVSLPQRGPWSEQSGASLVGGRLRYRMEKPLASWRITLSKSLLDDSAMDLRWRCVSPPFDYSSHRQLPANVAAAHFEQVGSVQGWMRMRGRELLIEGRGQRDKSWGVRDWSQVEGWNWISAQLGPELAFNAWEGWLGGKRHVNGFVWRDGDNHAIEQLSIRYRWTDRAHVPAAVELRLIDSSGATTIIEAEALGHFPLVKKGLWIQETHMRFKTAGDGPRYSGLGVVEHAWRAGRLGSLLRAPQLLRAAAQVLGW